MARKSLPPHLRKSGPGTAGRNAERDAKICALAADGMKYSQIAKQFPSITAERIRQIVFHANFRARMKREGWLQSGKNSPSVTRICHSTPPGTAAPHPKMGTAAGTKFRQFKKPKCCQCLAAQCRRRPWHHPASRYAPLRIAPLKSRNFAAKTLTLPF
jgi:hypothetical protein